MLQDALTIRVAEMADLPVLHDLIESAYRGDRARRGWTHEADMLEDQRIDEPTLMAIVDHPQQHLLTAWTGEELAGCVHISAVASDRAYFGLFAVRPGLQNGGIGKRIMAAAEDRARLYFGAEWMEMTVITRRAELIAYYERRGYARTGETRPFPADVEPPLFLAVLEKKL